MDQCKTDTTIVLDRAGNVSLYSVCSALRPFTLGADDLASVGVCVARFSMVDWTMMAVAVSIAFKALRGEYAIDRRCLPASVALAGILAILTTIF
jgi:hypothetical protein